MKRHSIIAITMGDMKAQASNHKLIGFWERPEKADFFTIEQPLSPFPGFLRELL
jgi:hypothetical protein